MNINQPVYTTEQLLQESMQLMALQTTEDNTKALQDACNFMQSFIQKSSKNITVETFNDNNKPSILAYIGANRPKKFDILLNGHIDVVQAKPSQFLPRIANDNLYGRGSYDMKAACIIMAAVFCELADTVPYSLGLQIVSDEESGGFNGTNFQIQQGVAADFVICGESGRAINAYEIANAAKGGIIATIRFIGSGAHGAYPWKADNPILKATSFIQKLKETYPTPTDDTDKTTISVTAISTDSKVYNATPNYTDVNLDIRYPASDKRFSNATNFTEFIHHIDSSAIVHAMPVVFTPFYTSPSHPKLALLRKCAEQTENTPFVFTQRNGSSDGRLYGATGAAICEFGIAGYGQHEDNEHVPLTAFANYYHTLRLFIMKSSR